ncbi:hypothetical protein [Streptomyces bambusae]|uniref:Uncharacterized protein n=1 Tax=Streptomyces bambusae TaxID=1550616 RepID=A0ABS6Z154_9ACTN|nr:hypothetical protein [Streptomyces bambusae]MBW5481447.1 hypothetical protein [Streptomyces bambusae]
MSAAERHDEPGPAAPDPAPAAAPVPAALSMQALLASCAAANAVSTPPRLRPAAVPPPEADEAAPKPEAA